MTKKLLLLLVIIFAWTSVSAQDASTTATYPTVEALNAAVIPARDRVALAERLRGVSNIPPTPASAPTRQVGDHETFTASNADELIRSIPATLRVVGKHIYLWVEDGATVRTSDLQGLADDFDNHIYDAEHKLWGSEADPGVDGDPHIYGLFAHGLGASTAAYFASDHTYPREVVPVSNEHEMFFFNLDSLGADFPLQAVDSVVAHEFQHMIRFNLQVNTETWLNEGLSVFTQFYLYQQLDSSVLSFLYQPDTQLDSWNADPNGRAPNYGAATLFLVYFYDRYGLDAMHQLSADHELRGLTAINDVLTSLQQPDVSNFFGDWALANFLNDPNYDNGIYSYPNVPRLPSPTPIDTITQLPETVQPTVNQYGTDYLTVANLSGVQSLDFKVTAPTTVALVPTEAPSGTHFWYSNRADMADTRLTHAFDLSGVSSAMLRYSLWYDLENNWDYGYLMISDDNGATWHIQTTLNETVSDPHGVAYGAGYTGASYGWIHEAVPLDEFAGKKILVRFEMITDDAVNRPGLALDDVSIPQIGYSSDFEQDGGGWQPEGWLWTDNRLPQTGWVQVAQQVGGKTAAVERWLLDGSSDHTLDLVKGVSQVVVAVSPFAPVTTVPLTYTLSVLKP